MTPIVHTLHHCEAHCEHMITFVLRADCQKRVRQLQLLRDCTAICALAAKYVASHSAFAKAIVNLCATVCETCGNECLRFPDLESQNCAQICLGCARECRAFALAQTPT